PGMEAKASAAINPWLIRHGRCLRQGGCLALEFGMSSTSRDFTVRLQSDLLHDHVVAFQTALDLFGQADLGDFLPPRDHPRFLDVLGELVRLELKQGWKTGQPTSLETYRTRYPELAARPLLLYKLVGEEFLLRRQAGENPSMADYRRRFELDPNEWPTLRVRAFDPETSSKLDIVLGAPIDSLAKTRLGEKAKPATDPEIECAPFDV